MKPVHKLCILLLLAIFLSCKVTEKPVFESIKQVQLLEYTSKHMVISADAIFKNPNHVGGHMSSEGITVFINDRPLTKLTSEKFKVPALDQFVIPLRAEIPTDSIWKLETLESAFNNLLKRKVKVSYKGAIRFELLGVGHNYPIDYSKEVKIKF